MYETDVHVIHTQITASVGLKFYGGGKPIRKKLFQKTPGSGVGGNKGKRLRHSVPIFHSLLDLSSLTTDRTWAQAVKVPGHNHRTAREFPRNTVLNHQLFYTAY